MSERKKGFTENIFSDNNFSAKRLCFKDVTMENQSVLSSLYSSNKPGFIGFITNRGIDDKRLKGGFRKI